MRWLKAARGFIHIWYGVQAKVRCSPVKYHSNTVILTISSYVPRWPSSSILCRLIVHVYTIEKFKCTKEHESESSHTFIRICRFYTNSNNWDIFVKREVIRKINNWCKHIKNCLYFDHLKIIWHLIIYVCISIFAFQGPKFNPKILCISLHLYPTHVYSSSIAVFLVQVYGCPSLVSVQYSKKKDLFPLHHHITWCSIHSIPWCIKTMFLL